MEPGTTTKLVHGRIELALHALRGARPGGDAAPALLLLHDLAGRSPSRVPASLASWPGAVHALDFTGHGASTLPRGGGYTAEVLLGDADAALRHLGGATLLGRGLGAYVALLLAGVRASQVRGAILCDGPGLAGGGPLPATPFLPDAPLAGSAPPDPWALYELSRDPRPPDYVVSFARMAAQLSGLESPVAVCCTERPSWLEHVVREPGVVETTLPKALARYACTTGSDPR
ncbi:MAG: alpha/beta hydrolase [Myxococcota bacterium]|nr:alpha/beta hydrolase [Myxococcota bacterium]